MYVSDPPLYCYVLFLPKFDHYDNVMPLSFIVVTMNTWDRYEIIGLCKISHSIKQPSSSICLKSVINA